MSPQQDQNSSRKAAAGVLKLRYYGCGTEMPEGRKRYTGDDAITDLHL